MKFLKFSTLSHLTFTQHSHLAFILCKINKCASDKLIQSKVSLFSSGMYSFQKCLNFIKYMTLCVALSTV